MELMALRFFLVSRGLRRRRRSLGGGAWSGQLGGSLHHHHHAHGAGLRAGLALSMARFWIGDESRYAIVLGVTI